MGLIPFGLVDTVNVTRVCGNGQLMERPVVRTRVGENARLYIRADVWRPVVSAASGGAAPTGLRFRGHDRPMPVCAGCVNEQLTILVFMGLYIWGFGC